MYRRAVSNITGKNGYSNFDSIVKNIRSLRGKEFDFTVIFASFESVATIDPSFKRIFDTHELELASIVMNCGCLKLRALQSDKDEKNRELSAAINSPDCLTFDDNTDSAILKASTVIQEWSNLRQRLVNIAVKYKDKADISPEDFRLLRLNDYSTIRPMCGDS